MRASVFRAISDPNRRRILALLQKGERPVAELVSSVDITFGAVSQHLKVLREAGLVSRRKDGRRRIYRRRALCLVNSRPCLKSEPYGRLSPQPEAGSPA